MIYESTNAKLAWAKHHLTIVESELDRYGQSNSGHAMLDAHENVDSFLMERFHDLHPIPSSIPLSIGDFAQNLMSVFDYLVHDIVVANGKQPTKQTAFPVCKTSEQFRHSRNDRLSGVPGIFVAMIERLQPYHSRDLYQDTIFILDEITNISKHRRILITRPKGKAIFGSSGLRAAGSALSLNLSMTRVQDDTHIPTAISTSEQVQMHYQIASDIAFGEGCAKGKFVAEFLNEAIEYVERIISSFQTVFAGGGH